jgi:predicted RNA-binding Zn-ribbon protein involved in translation (DUF1610 family)
MPYCASCDAELPADLRVGRETLCPHCDAYLHACVQCRFYEPTLHNQCLEPEADYVGDRQKANFCDFFALAGTRGASGRADPKRGRPAAGNASAPAAAAKPGATTGNERAKEARAKLEALFKTPPKDDDD